MLKEIYLRTPQEPKFNENNVETSNTLESYLSKLRMILFTTPGDILFEPEFGIGLDNLLFDLNANEVQIKQRFREQIFRYCPEASEFETDVQVSFIRGIGRDIGIVDVFVKGQASIRVRVN